MPEQNNPSPSPSPFEITTSSKSKKGGNKGVIVAVLIVVFLILSVVAGILLVQQNQNIAEKALVPQCPEAEQCPVTADKTYLRNCHPPQTDGSPDERLCNKTRMIGDCGGNQWCCPKVGGVWTRDLRKCAAVTASPTATATATATSRATATPTATATGTGSATATPTATATSTTSVQTTSKPIPVTGTDWPSVVGAGIGVFVIIGSILLAL